MLRTLDFNAFAAGTVIDHEYASLGVTVSAAGGAGQAMIFDSSNPTEDDTDLGSSSLGGLLIVSEDGDGSDPDDNAGGGSIFFDFDDLVRIKALTFKDIEKSSGSGTRMIFYDDAGNVIDNQFVPPTGDGGERTVLLAVTGVARMEVRLEGSGAIDNLIFDDGTVPGENTPPEAFDDTFEMAEDTVAVIFPLENDSDPDRDPLTITDASSPNGTVTYTDTSVTFTPAPDYNGPATVTYTITDGNGGTDTADINIAVTPVNDPPVAVNDLDTTPQATAVVVDLRGNDTDVDDPTPTLTITGASSPDGTVANNGDGTVTFTPAAAFIGTATISYTVADPDGLSDEGVALVTVTSGTGGPDGYIDGDETGNLIDLAYADDPNGDFIDNDDAILPGTDSDDDYVRAGGGDDTVEAGDGNDTVAGGAGADIINTGNDDLAHDLDYPFEPSSDALGYGPDSNPDNDRDSVDGGAGNDTISTGDDRDTINGEGGADVIDGGIDDDIISGGEDDDRIVGGEGNDNILGGAGNDTVYAGNDPDLGLDVLDIPDEAAPGFGFSPDRQPLNGRDTLDGGAGNDVILGADDDDLLIGGIGDDFVDGQIDDDTVLGGAGNDTLAGGRGDDSIQGDEGDDTLLGGAGADTMSGGAGQDTFNVVSAGDVIDGGSGPVDFDTLNLAGSAPEGGRFEVTFTSGDNEDGFVSYFNADDSDAGHLDFVEIENVVPCFTPGTRIATPTGERKVEDLKVGDRIITRDNGMQEIRWVGAREMTGAELEAAPHLKPVLIQEGALGHDLPERDMLVSPQHRVLIANDKTALYFEEREVLIAAKHLTDRDGIDVVDVSGTTYIHILFDQHEVILSDGAWTESFQFGDMSLAGIGQAQRDEILALFPELATEESIESYSAARKSLKRYEARLLSD